MVFYSFSLISFLFSFLLSYILSKRFKLKYRSTFYLVFVLKTTSTSNNMIICDYCCAFLSSKTTYERHLTNNAKCITKQKVLFSDPKYFVIEEKIAKYKFPQKKHIRIRNYL